MQVRTKRDCTCLYTYIYIYTSFTIIGKTSVYSSDSQMMNNYSRADFSGQQLRTTYSIVIKHIGIFNSIDQVEV